MYYKKNPNFYGTDDEEEYNDQLDDEDEEEDEEGNEFSLNFLVFS